MKTKKATKPEAQAKAAAAKPRKPMNIIAAIGDIQPSPFNPRANFGSEADLKMLEDVKENGVLSDLWARRVDGQLQLIAGHRRLWCARKAKLATVPVKDFGAIDDRRARVLQAIENLQRQDLTPLECAAGFKGMIDEGMTIAEIADEVGRSESTIRGQLKLIGAPKILVSALNENPALQQTAIEICAVPDQEERAKFASFVLAGCANQWQYGRGEKPHKAGAPLSARETIAFRQRVCQIELKQASFSRKSIDLLPAAGACNDCIKRGANNAVCLDVRCFAAKTDAYTNWVAEEAKRSGAKIMGAEEAEPLFTHWGELHTDGAGKDYVEMSAQCAADKKGRTIRQIVGAKAATYLIVAIDPKGQPRQLLTVEDAERLLKAEGIAAKLSGGGGASTPEGRKEKLKRQRELELQRKTRRACLKEVGETVRNMLRLAATPRSMNGVWRVLARRAIQRAAVQFVDDLVCAEGIGETVDAAGKGPRKDGLLSLVSGWTPSECLAVVVQFEFIDQQYAYGGTDQSRKEFNEAIGIDPKAIEDQVEERLAVERKEKKEKGVKPRSRADAPAMAGAARVVPAPTPPPSPKRTGEAQAPVPPSSAELTPEQTARQQAERERVRSTGREIVKRLEGTTIAVKPPKPKPPASALGTIAKRDKGVSSLALTDAENAAFYMAGLMTIGKVYDRALCSATLPGMDVERSHQVLGWCRDYLA